MSGRKRLRTHLRNNLIVDIIFQHKGKENAISMKELATALGEKGYKTEVNNIHTIVKEVTLERKLPICSEVYSGYWWGASKQDIEVAIDALQGKIDGLQKRIDLLKSFICE